MMENLSVVFQSKVTREMQNRLDRWIECVKVGVMKSSEVEHRVIAYASALFDAGVLTYNERSAFSLYYREKVAEVKA